MKSAIYSGLISLFILFCNGCDRVDDRDQERLQAIATLRQLVMEGQAFIIDQTPSDAMAFDKWIASYPPTNASTGLKLSSTFTAIWFNTNYNDWVYSIGSNQLSSTQTAVIGEYKSSDGPQLIGVSFTGGLVPTKAVPNIDFGERYAFSDR